MKKNLLFLFLAVTLIFSACSKSSDSNNPSNAVNTWSFKEGSKTFSGVLAFDASLNTFLQGNNSYTFGMIGPEKSSGFIFNLILSLTDLNFTSKNYQSGVSGNDYLNAFYYLENLVSTDNIYKSSNLDPGPIMTYNITSYDAAKDIVTITFSGQAQDVNGTLVNITEGKVTAKIERL